MTPKRDPDFPEIHLPAGRRTTRLQHIGMSPSLRKVNFRKVGIALGVMPVVWLGLGADRNFDPAAGFLQRDARAVADAGF